MKKILFILFDVFCITILKVNAQIVKTNPALDPSDKFISKNKKRPGIYLESVRGFDIVHSVSISFTTLQFIKITK